MDFEPTLRWREPAIGYIAHSNPAFAKPERDRFLFAAITGVAFDSNCHVVTILLSW
jgi:hypothetical protein